MIKARHGVILTPACRPHQGSARMGERAMSMNESAAPRLVVPALSGLYEALAPYSYSFMRFWVGAIMVPHGYVKLFNGGITNTAAVLAKAGFEPSFAWAYLVSGVEFF